MARTITATDALTMDAAHLRGLTAYGPGWALMWDGRDVFAAHADVADHGAVFEIIDCDDLTAMHEAHTRRGQRALRKAGTCGAEEPAEKEGQVADQGQPQPDAAGLRAA
ncbi:hypothetical protein ABT120_56050 [Nonomuraea angiospora]|uniref:hypothetical protein n=1 Tax=Nonomuraea angiospora TaxID=46172 RepID=UPI0033250913